MTNQYLPVSSSQMRTVVRKIISASAGERSDSSPDRKREREPAHLFAPALGQQAPISQLTTARRLWGNMAASRKTSQRADKGDRAPQGDLLDTAQRCPSRPVRRASSGRLRKTKPSMTTPSKMRSTMTVASEAETGTPSRCLEDDRAQHLAGAGRVDVVAHVADGDDGEHGAGGDLLQAGAAGNASARCAPTRPRSKPRPRAAARSTSRGRPPARLP